MRHWAFSILMAATLAAAPSAAFAQDRNAVRNQAKNTAAEIRALGEPKDRCSLDAFIVDGGIVIRTLPSSRLVPGDQLHSLNGQVVEGSSSQEIINLLRTLAPSATVQAKVKRAGAETPLELACSNARPANEALLSALDSAAAGKFDECVTALAARSDLGAPGVGMKAQCAAVSKKPGNYSQAQFTFEAVQSQIEDAHWNAPARSEAINSLRMTEGVITQGLGTPTFQQLVTLTERWPGGERMWAASTPDWAKFKQSGEAALRNRLIDPESARIEWPYGFTQGFWKPLFAKQVDGYWTCGSINARNRMGGYTGSTSFVVVLDASANVKYVEMGDPSSNYDLLTGQCRNSSKFLPPPPVAFVAATSPAASPASLADELKKLSDLKNSGVLTEAEFEAAKKRLLGQ